MSTALLYRHDPYLAVCDATVTAVSDGAIHLDRTVFYAEGGGQPGDTGRLVLSDGGEIPIIGTRKGETEDIVLHLPAPGYPQPAPGAKVHAEIDWGRRYRLMRMHSCLHVLCAVIAAPVTGGQVSDGRGRLDFDWPEASLDKDELTATLNRLIAEDRAISQDWITDAELSARPELVRTMSVKPPTGAGRVRLIRIDRLDLQPCGGTHVQRTSEIGAVVVTKIEKKGRLNRRVHVVLADSVPYSSPSTRSLQ